MSTMEAELVAAALTMKEAIFCSNMLIELGFGNEVEKVPLYIDNTATLHVIGNRAYSSRTKHIALRFCSGRILGGSEAQDLKSSGYDIAEICTFAYPRSGRPFRPLPCLPCEKHLTSLIYHWRPPPSFRPSVLSDLNK